MNENFKRKKVNKKKVRREQPRKDSSAKRINLDNERESKFIKDISDEFKRKDSNDISWYSHNPNLLTSVARIPFGTISGLSNAAETGFYTMPSVMALHYAPNFLPNEPVVSQAFTSMYSDIVHANSRNQSYDYVDLAMMIYAGCEVFSAIASGIRVYGLMQNYFEQQNNLPRLLARACGFNFKDLRDNYSHMWADLLQLIAQSRQIWIPNTIDIIQRRFWMCSNVYADSDSARAQYYVYVPATFYKYAGYTASNGGKLTKVDYDNVQYNSTLKYNKWSEYVSMVQGLIDAMMPDQDRGIMYGDILKAYGEERIFAIRDIDIGYKTSVTYNKEVLWQMEHFTPTRAIPLELRHASNTGGGMEQYWRGHAVEDTATAPSSEPYFKPMNKAILNFRQTENPTPEQIAIATRMMSLRGVWVPHYTKASEDAEPVKDGTKKVCIPAVCGTEIAFNIATFGYNPSNINTEFVDGNGLTVRYNETMDPKFYARWSAFDWAPIMYKMKVTQTAFPWEYSVEYPIFESDNWTYISAEELEGIHNAILYSLFNVPVLKG